MGSATRVVVFHTGGLIVNSHHLCAALPGRRAFHPISCAVIEHPTYGPVLFDTGLGSRTAELVTKRPFRLLARLARLVFAEHHQLRCQLETLGYEPAAVEHVIMSHLHFDHTGGMRDLPSAVFHVASAEWDSVHALPAIKGVLRGFYLDDFKALPINLVDYQLDAAIWPFDAAFDLFGDGSVLLLPTPGHTGGHQCALVRLQSGQQVLLGGDAAMVRQNYMLPADQSLVSRKLRYDHEAAWRAILKLRAYWRANPEAVIITAHDGQLGRTLKRGPLVLT